MFLILRPEVYAGKDTDQLFPGTSQSARFNSGLRSFLSRAKKGDANELVQDLRTLMEELDLEPDDIGSHSCRKGASSDVMSGSTAGPSIVAVAHRAGWVLSQIFSIYLKMENAGDHYVGRLAAGLDVNSPAFATLPYHFAVDNDSVRNVASLCFPSLWNIITVES